MKNIINIVFFKLYNHNADFYQAVIVTTGIILINFFSIYLLTVTIGLLNFTTNYKRDSSIERFIYGPIIICIFCLPIYFYLKRDNFYLKLNEKMKNLDDKNLKKINMIFWLYIIGSIIFLFLSILSGFIKDMIF